MPNSMEIDPAVLRELAEQHERVARDTDHWANQPVDWLDAFPDTYGHIADPVHKALKTYYQARENAGRQLAQRHRDTAKQLRKAARDFEIADDDGRRLIDGSGDGDRPGTSAPPAPSAPVPAGAQPSVPVGPDQAAPPTAVTPGHSGVPGTDDIGESTRPSVSAPVEEGDDRSFSPDTGGPDEALASDVGNDPGQPPAPAVSGSGPGVSTGLPDTSGAAGATPAGGAIPAGGAMPPAGAVPPPAATAGPGSVSADRVPGSPAAGTAAASAGAAAAPATPFAAAVAAAKERDAAPAHVVGDAVDDDLVVARTLLSAVLGAVDTSVLGVHWAVAVMRGPGGAGVFITSNEGRGWLPAGVYLPREVSTPWVWDELLADGSDSVASPWEGITDPARVLVEFGLAWGNKAGAQLSALVSSGSIDSGLRRRFPQVSAEGMVGPAYDIDLRIQTPDTTDRLGLTGSAQSLTRTAAVDDAQIRPLMIELATQAHAAVGRGSGAESDQARGVRERILAAIDAGREVPGAWWRELRDADDLLAAAMLPRRVDVGRVEPGELRIDHEAAALRGLVFERRCNELVMLLSGEPDAQQLRDAVYAHDQVVEHPQFVPAPAAVSATADERVSRPVVAPGGPVSAPTVSAPSVTAGPPPGTVAAPDTAPPGVSGRS